MEKQENHSMPALTALSVLDGRYRKYTGELNDIFSEYGLIRHRVHVEIQWLKFLFRDLELETVNERAMGKIASIAASFNHASALQIKAIEKETNHDVKAVEYYIKRQLSDSGLADIGEWVHFACTSEDINNIAYALMIKEGLDVFQAHLATVVSRIETLAIEYKRIPMISLTHGQPATPTTVGKEFVNFAWRLSRESRGIRTLSLEAKINGASGNFNAHCFAFPHIDWIAASRRFLSDYLGLTPIMFTTQINPYSYLSEMLHALIRVAAVVIDLDRDMWGYISRGYFRQKTRPGEVGSSTMPHKVNPIDFENSEGNMGLAIALMEHLSVKLLHSRFQRDLTDSTVLRNLGAVFGYLLIGLQSALKGLDRITLDADVIAQDVAGNPELVAEAVQTIMRVFKEENPYEKLKELTRGRKSTEEEISNLIDVLEKVPHDVKKRMKQLTAENYIGLAEELVDLYFAESGHRPDAGA
jgi:adenylosuccinate lyase